MTGRMYGNNAAKAAIEIALHDLVGRATSRPAPRAARRQAEQPHRAPRRHQHGELAADLRDAENKKADGYAAFKIKVGIDKPLVDAERTRRVCALLGPGAC